MKETSEAMEPALKKLNGNRKRISACVESLTKRSQLQTWMCFGSVLSSNGYCTSLEELLRTVELPAFSCTPQGRLVLKTLRRHVSPHLVYTLADLLRDPCREQHVSIGGSDISMNS